MSSGPAADADQESTVISPAHDDVDSPPPQPHQELEKEEDKKDSESIEQDESNADDEVSNRLRGKSVDPMPPTPGADDAGDMEATEDPGAHQSVKQDDSKDDEVVDKGPSASHEEQEDEENDIRELHAKEVEEKATEEAPEDMSSSGHAQPKRGSSFQKGMSFLSEKRRSLSESQQSLQLNQKMKGFAGSMNQKTKGLAGSVNQKTKGLADSMKNKKKELAESNVVKNMSAKVPTFQVVGKLRETVNNKAGPQPALQVNVGPNAWQGVANDTLSPTLQEKHWADVKILVSEERALSARGEHIASQFVAQGSRIQWCFAAKERAINFSVRVQVHGSNAQEAIVQLRGSDHSGSWVAHEDSIVKLIFENKHSVLKVKALAYVVGFGPAAGDVGPNSQPVETFSAGAAGDIDADVSADQPAAKQVDKEAEKLPAVEIDVAEVAPAAG